MLMRRTIIALLCFTSLAFGQARKEFEVASIRPATDQLTEAAGAGLHIDGSQVRIVNLSLKDYISIAYRMRINQIVGPDWLSAQRFDVAAKVPDGGVQADVLPMLQSLLEERFQMKAHREMREFPVYALEVAKTGLKVMPTTPDGDPFARRNGPLNLTGGGTSAGINIDLGEGSYFMLGETTVETKNLSMATLATMLTRFVDRAVVDMTDLKGGYDLKLEVTPEDRTSMLIRSAVGAGVVLPPQALALLNVGSIDSLSNALKKIGLTLDARKAPLEVIVVDRMEKTPSEN
jgi:uncharacterized protein (TIGR03435 family)